MANDMLEAALELIRPKGSRHAMKIFPLQCGRKTPATQDGFKAASDDESQIRLWWASSTYNIGLCTGAINGILVLDVDQKPDEGHYGEESLGDLENRLGKLPDSWQTLTPSGGRHLWFKYPKNVEIRSSASVIADSIDIRAGGGYVVVPPSVLPNGRYEWEISSIPEETPLAELPQSWIDYICNAKGKKSAQGTEKSNSSEQQTLFTKAFELPKKVPTGARNDTMMRYLCSLRARGESPTNIFRAAQRENQSRFEPPIEAGELENIFNSVLRYADGTAIPTAVFNFVQENEKIDAKSELLDLLNQLQPEKSHRFRQSDLGNGNLFADIFMNKAKYVPERRTWFVYDGRRWLADSESKMTMELCKQLADALLNYAASLSDEETRLSYISFARKWQRRAQRETILKDASSVYPARMDDFDSNPWDFNCQNGTLDLNTRAFRPHSAADMLTKVSGVTFDPEASCPRWEKFIDEVMCEDAEKALFLQKAAGYSLTGDTSEECFFVLYGSTTRNGKSSFCETFRHVLGDYGRSMNASTIAQKDHQNSSSPNEDIARLNGVRFVNVAEPEKNMILSSALVKTMTGSDTISARFLHENSFEFQPHFKLWLNSNHLPQITDPTVFSSGRVKVLEFLRHFEPNEQDHTLKSTLAKPESLSGILNWCLDGLKFYFEAGLEPPQSVQDATNAYKKESDKTARFIDEMLSPKMGAKLKLTQVFAMYQNWCTQCGFMPQSIRSFKQDIQSSVTIALVRPSPHEEKTSCLVNFCLKNNSTASDSDLPF